MNALPTEPQPHPALSDGGQALMGVSWFFTAIAIQAVLLRFYLRRKFNQSVGADDWIMLLALTCHIVFQSFLTVASLAGLGRPVTSMTAQEIIDMSKWAWCTTPGSILAGVAARISIAIVLVQIFGMRQWFKWLMISYTGFLTIIGLANFIFVWLQARPIEALWDFRILAVYRMPQLPQKVLTGILMVLLAFSDFMFAFFPVMFIWKLNMARRKKIGLILVMAGSVVTMAAAIGRVILVFWAAGSKTEVDMDKTFVLFGVTSLLASVEQSLVIVIGSIPKLKIVTKLNFPKASALNSSLSSFIHKLRYGSQSGTSTSATSHSWTYSNVELNRTGKSNLAGHPGAQYDSTVQGGYQSSRTNSRDQESGIRVTEGYSVTYNGTLEPKVYV